jgi:hypothetical protein
LHLGETRDPGVFGLLIPFEGDAEGLEGDGDGRFSRSSERKRSSRKEVAMSSPVMRAGR